MKPAHRLLALLVGLALLLVLLAVASVALVAATLDAAERDTVHSVLASRAMLVVMLWLAVFAVAAWGLMRAFERFVQAPARLHEQAQVLLGEAAVRELDAQGTAANRGLAETFNTLVLMLTAKGRDTDVAKGLGSGADAYMTKPFSTRELVARVRQMLEGRA